MLSDFWQTGGCTLPCAATASAAHTPIIINTNLFITSTVT
jgi:hypothetical protein